MSRLAPALTVVALLGCEPPPDTSGKAEGDAKTAEGSKTAADEGAAADPNVCERGPIEAELKRFCDYDIGIPPVDIPKVPWAGPSYHPTTSTIMTLTKRGLLDPQGAKKFISIQDWLADPPRRVPEPGELAIAVAADVPVSAVAELQRGLSAKGRKEVRFLVQVTEDTPVPQPRLPELLETLTAQTPGDPSKRLMLTGQLIKQHGAECEELGGAFQTLAMVGQDERCAHLAKASAAALEHCNCTKRDEIMTLLYAMTMGFEPPKGRTAAVPVALDPQAKYRPKEGMTFGELAVEQFTDTQLHHLWLDVVAPPMVPEGATPPAEPAPAAPSEGAPAAEAEAGPTPPAAP